VGVLAGFDGVDGVPEGEAVVDPVGRTVGSEDLAMGDITHDYRDKDGAVQLPGTQRRGLPTWP
jgi:hypothetical protein